MEEVEWGVKLDAQAVNPKDRVEYYMRAHRKDFENSRQQRFLCELDKEADLKSKQTKERMDSRFHSNY